MEEVRLGKKREQENRPKLKLLISGFKFRPAYLQHSYSFPFSSNCHGCRRKSVRTRQKRRRRFRRREEKKTGRKERMEGLLQLPRVHAVGVIHARNHLPHTLQFGSRRAKVIMCKSVKHLSSSGLCLGHLPSLDKCLHLTYDLLHGSCLVEMTHS